MNKNRIDALLIAPPLSALHRSGAIADEIVHDAGQPFEHPQGLLSIASYARSQRDRTAMFDVRVIPLDLHVAAWERNRDGSVSWSFETGDVNTRAIEVTTDYISRLRPRVVGISAQYYLSELFALHLAAAIKDSIVPAPYVVLGGQEVTFYDAVLASGMRNALMEEYPAVDAIVRKEGELTFQKLLEAIRADRHPERVEGVTWRDARGIHVERDRMRCSAADLTPLDYDCLVLPSGVTTEDALRSMNVSFVLVRGCHYGNCAFCTSSNWFGGNNSIHRLSSSALREARRNWESDLRTVLQAGVRDIQILDETLSAVPAYFRTICEILERLGRSYAPRVVAQTRVDCVDAVSLQRMRQVGVDLLYVGIESGSEMVIDRMMKGFSTPLLADSRLIAEVNRELGEDLAGRFPAVIHQMVLAVYLIKRAGMRVGTFWMIGHPGSSPEEEARSRSLLRFFADKRLIDAGDPVEVAVYLPLNGTRARGFPEVQIVDHDKSGWGRLSGDPPHNLLRVAEDGTVGEIAFGRHQIGVAFDSFRELVVELGLTLAQAQG